MTSVIPTGRSHTTGCPVHPDPHQVVVSPPTVESPHMPPVVGNRQATDGSSVGIGPVPYQLRVGLPRNMVRPLTVPHGFFTVAAGTTSGGRTIVVVVPAVVAGLVCRGASVSGGPVEPTAATVVTGGIGAAAGPPSP